MVMINHKSMTTTTQPPQLPTTLTKIGKHRVQRQFVVRRSDKSTEEAGPSKKPATGIIQQDTAAAAVEEEEEQTRDCATAPENEVRMLPEKVKDYDDDDNSSNHESVESLRSAGGESSTPPWHREPLLESPPSSDNDTSGNQSNSYSHYDNEDEDDPASEAAVHGRHGGRSKAATSSHKGLSSTDDQDTLELVGCAACGECFETSSALGDHQENRCPGLSSETEGEDEYSGLVLPPRTRLACPKCPDLDFSGRCELVIHLKAHRRRNGHHKHCSKSPSSIRKNHSISMTRSCVCRTRPCRCSLSARRALRNIRAKRQREALMEGDSNNDSNVVMPCHNCFSGKLRLDKGGESSIQQQQLGAHELKTVPSLSNDACPYCPRSVTGGEGRLKAN